MRHAPTATPPAGLTRVGAACSPRPTTPRPNAARGDEDELYRRHHRDLQRAVAHAVNAPRELIEDACQTAWAILLRRQPERHTIFAWLRVVAIHEAYRLSAIDRRDARLERARPDDGDWQTSSPTRVARRDARGARGAPRAGVPARAPTQRPRAQGRRLQLQGDPRANARTHAHQRQQVAREGPGSHPADATPRSRADRERRARAREGAKWALVPLRVR